MRATASDVRFDHGAALRVPPPGDSRSWRALWTWLGDDGFAMDDAAAVQVLTPDGPIVAHSGDWIVLSVTGDFHVAHAVRTCDA